MTEAEETRIVITAMVAAQVMHETLDELQDTPYHKQKLKHVTKQFQIEISKSCDKTIAAMYEADETAMNNLQEGIHEIAQKIATMDPVIFKELRERISTL